MNYEPTTLNETVMNERLSTLDDEFFALAHVMNIITANTELILSELEKRINALPG
jgi:hypothetical protein